MSTLVTGAGGFVGQWLVRALLARGEGVFGTTLSGEPEGTILDSSERERVRWIAADMRDEAAVGKAVDTSNADKIYHLAGVAFLPTAQKDPAIAYDVNVLGFVRLAAHAARRGRSGSSPRRILVVGSGEQYGFHAAEEYPLKESAEQRPLTVYAASKAAQEIAALQAVRSGEVEIVATRSFNHSGAGQDPSFLLPGLVERVRCAIASRATRFPIGNTTPVRDFLHVTDVVAAYIALMETGSSGGVYNVSSGEGHSVGELIALTLEIAQVHLTPETDAALARPADIPISVGDSSKLRTETGWSPQRTPEDVIRDLWSFAS